MSLIEPLLSLLHLARPAERMTRRTPDWVDASNEPNAAPGTDERTLGCGWFDSSHDLRHGLLVREHSQTDAAAAQLPLGLWLHLHLAEGGRMAPRG